MQILEVGGCCASIPQSFARALNTRYISFLPDTNDPHRIPITLPTGRDYVNRLYNLPLFLSLIQDYDVLHFHFMTMLPGYLDTHLYNGTTKILHYHGSDIRGHPYREKLSRGFDIRIVSTPDLLSCVPGATHIPQMVNPIQNRNHPRDEITPIRIAHAPSRKEKKGTDVIIRAIQKIQRRIPIEFDLIHGVSRSEALERIARSDIVIDQVTPFGMYGVVSIEALYLGKTVLCSINPAYYPADCPIISVAGDGSDLESQLLRTIQDTDWEAGGDRGRSYALCHHSPDAVKRQFLELLQ